MIIEETVNNLIRDILNLKLAPNFAIKDKQNAPRPTGVYATVGYLSTQRIGYSDRKLENNIADPDLTETITGYREMMFSLSFYRAGCFDFAEQVRTSFEKQSILDLLNAAQLGFTSVSDVRDLSLALSSNWETRAQFDLILSTIASDSDIITAIETLDISGKYEVETLTYNFQIEVP